LLLTCRIPPLPIKDAQTFFEYFVEKTGILPFMAFGEYMQNAQMIGADEGDIEKTAAESSEGAIVIETLVNIRVVASLSMEEERTEKYGDALKLKNKNSTLGKNTIGGAGQGMGSFFQMWGKCTGRIAEA
jgi:hypothetical protein